MATRYYFPFSTGAPAAPVTTIPVASAWDLTASGYHQHQLVTTKQNTPLTAETSANFTENVTTVGNMVHAQYVSDPLGGDQTISGNFTLVLRCGEVATGGGTNSNADCSLQVVIRVIAPDGSVRGTVYGGHTTALNQTSGNVGQEMNTSTQVRLFNNIAVSNTVNALNGDRVVVELGHRHHNTVNDFPYGSFLHLGDSTAVADHPVSTTTEAKPGWIELTSTLVHNWEGSGSISETGSLTSTGQKVAQTSLTLGGTGSLVNTGAKSAAGSASISGTATLTPAGIKVAKGTGTISGLAIFAKSGKKVAKGTATIADTGTLTPVGLKNANGSATASGTGSLVSSGKKVAAGDNVLSGTGNLVSSGAGKKSTRYYFPFGVGAPSAPVTTIAPSSAWNTTGAGFSRGYLVTRKRGTVLFAETSSQFMETAATVGNMLHQQYVSDPIANDQTISGLFTLVLRGGEVTSGGTASSADASLQCVVRVIKPDGTERGVLYGGHSANLSQASGALGQEFATSTQVRLMNGVAVTPVSAIAGDRIVVEIGHRYHNVSATPYGAYLHLGDAAGADHALGTATQAAPGWFELSQGIGHIISGDATPISAAADIVGVGKKIAKRSVTLTATGTLTSSGARSAGSTILVIPFEGTDEANVTTTGTGLDTVTPGAGTITFESTNPYSGSTYMEVATGATAAAPITAATISPGRATLFARFFIKYNTAPSVDQQVFRMRGTGSAQRLTMKILTTGQVQLHDGTNVIATSVNPLATGKWVMIHAGYESGALTLKTYEGASLTTASKTLTGSTTSDTIQSIMFGQMVSNSNWTVNFDDAVFDYQAFPPGTDRIGGTGSITGTLGIARSGFKRAKGSWGIQENAAVATSTGAKNTGEFHGGSGTATNTSHSLSSSGRKVAKGTAAISTGTYSLSSIGKKVAKGTGSIAGTGSVVSSGIKDVPGTGSISGTGSVTGTSGNKHVTGAAGRTIPGVGSLTPAGRKVAKGGPGTVSGVVTTFGSSGQKRKVFVTGSTSNTSHSLTSVGRKTAKGSGTASGTLSTTPLGKKIAKGDGFFYNGSSLTSDGGRNVNYAQGAGTATGSISASSQGQKVGKGSGGWSALAIFAKSGKKVAKGSVSISGTTGGPTASPGKKTAIANVTVSGSGSLVSIGAKSAVAGETLLSGFINASGTGRKTAKGSPSLPGAVSAVSAGRKNAKGTGFCNGSGSLTSTGNARQISFGSGQINANGNVSTSPGTKKVSGYGTASGSLVLFNPGRKIAKGSGSYSGGGTPVSVGRRVARGAGTLAGVVSEDSLGVKVGSGLGSVYGVGDLEQGGYLVRRRGFGMITNMGEVSSSGNRRNPQFPIRVGGKSGAIVINSNLGYAVPIGGYQEE